MTVFGPSTPPPTPPAQCERAKDVERHETRLENHGRDLTWLFAREEVNADRFAKILQRLDVVEQMSHQVLNIEKILTAIAERQP